MGRSVILKLTFKSDGSIHGINLKLGVLHQGTTACQYNYVYPGVYPFTI